MADGRIQEASRWALNHWVRPMGCSGALGSERQ